MINEREREMRAEGRVILEGSREVWHQDDVMYWRNKSSINKEKIL